MGKGQEERGDSMDKKRNLQLPPAVWAFAAAIVMTLLAGIGVLRRADFSVSDALYQSREASDGDIAIVEIDQRALEDIGPYKEWGLDIFAQTINTLNMSEDCRPAVICLDVLFTGETNPEADASLLEAAGRYGNVAFACAAEFGTALVEGPDGTQRLDPFSILDFSLPYEALREASMQGHINTMQDVDGVLRHHMLTLTLPDGTTYPSLALLAAEKYQEYHGLPPVTLPPTDSRNFWYVPFCGLPGDFDESISVSDVISGVVPPEYFAGKIVFIGPYATGLQDSFITAADHAQLMYGVEYQANAVQALLWGDYAKEAPDSFQLILLFVLLLLGFAGFWRGAVRFTTVLWALICGGWVAFCKGAYHFGWIFHVLWVPVGISILYIGCLAFNYIRAVMERRHITSTFQRYVAPEIVREILKDDEALELGGRLVNIAVLFVDVRGFTTMSELLDPEQVVEILNRYLTLISDCILRNKGTLDKFVGDAAMAFWGAPLPQEDYVMHAAQAAMDMVHGSEELSKELMERYGRTVSFGVGIHLGPAVVGNIGSPQRMDYTAIGDTVNTSARLEANAPGGTVYISRAVADALEGRIRVHSLGDTIKLKGKKEGFEILTLDEILPFHN